MAQKKPEEAENVTIIARREVSVYPKFGVEVKEYIITYVVPGLPPGNVTIDKDKWTQDKEKLLIKEDIKQRRTFKPETYKV